jgi:outer membrane protein assembly factor BamA
MGGSITGLAPDYKNFALGGIGSLRAFGYKMLKGNQMLLSNLELEFGSSREHGNSWPDLSNTTISIFMDSGYSNYNSNLEMSGNPLDHYDISFSDLSHNIGMGLGLGFLKLEIAKPISGTGGQSVFWLRLNPTF